MSLNTENSYSISVGNYEDLPEKISSKIGNESFQYDQIGMSKSSIMLFADKVLKIREASEEADNEALAMKWLEGKLSVPKVIAHERRGDKSFLLMSKAAGRMACEESYLNDPQKLTDLLAQALRELWRIDISHCPLDWTLDRKLKAAEYNVQNNLVDMDNVEPDTFGADSFKDPQDLLQWLKANRPTEELVLSHGDFCLPNIIIKDDGSVSFIDLGRMGFSDKWQDIALCYRSLKYNYSGKYGGKEYPGYDPEMLFKKLEIEPDWAKIRYYTLLDELF